MSKFSLLAILILAIFAKDATCQYGPMISNVSSIVDSHINNGLGDNHALSHLANSVAQDQHVSHDMLQHVNVSAIVHLFDQYSQDYLKSHCDKADSYFELLLSLNNTPYHNLTTLDRFGPLVACRRDCHFMQIFEANLTDHFNTALFLTERLTPKLAKMCSMGFSMMMGFQNQSANVSSMINLIKNNPAANLGAVFTPASIRRLSPRDAKYLIGNITSQTGLTPEFTKELGRFVPKNETLGHYLNIASGIPIDVIASASLTDGLNCLAHCDLHNFDDSRLGRLVNSILKHDSSSSTLRALMQTNNPEILNAIPENILSTMDLSSLDSSSLPARGQRMVANHILGSTHLSDIHDSSSLHQILPVLPLSTLADISGHDMIETYSRLLAVNRNGTTDALSSTQRSTMLQNVIAHAVNETGSTTPSVVFGHFNETDIENLAELFIEANETVISNLAQHVHLFDELIAEIAEIPDSKCVDYKAASRSLLASYAIRTLASNPSSPVESDLDMIGPCLASALPASILSSITPTVLHNRIFYFSDDKFQPDAQTAQTFSSKLSSIWQLSEVQADPITFLSDLGDSIVFLPNLGNVDPSIMASFGSQWLEAAKETRDQSNHMVQQHRLGVSGSSTINMQFMNAQSAVIHAIKQNALNQIQMHQSGHRRRRSSTPSNPPFTCDDCSDGKICLTRYSENVCQFSIDDLTSLTNDDMMLCLSIIGSASGCTHQNKTDIAQLVIHRLFNDSTAHIPDGHIQDMNQLIEGISPDNLAMLDIESMETINIIGELTNLTHDQLNNIMMPVRHFFGGSFDSSSLSIMGNLSCGLNDSDVHTVSDAEFNMSLPLLGEITNTAGNCSGVYPLYNRTRLLYGVNNLLTPEILGMIGSIAGGMPPADAHNLTNDMTSSIAPGAFSFMQVGTLGTIAVNNMGALTTDQLNTITNSDTYSSLPTSVQTSLNTQIDSTGSSSTTSTNGSPRQYAVSWFATIALLLSTLIAMSL